MAINKLKATELYHSCDTEQFDFKTTAKLESLAEVIGQKRAVGRHTFWCRHTTRRLQSICTRSQWYRQVFPRSSLCRGQGPI